VDYSANVALLLSRSHHSPNLLDQVPAGMTTIQQVQP